MQDINTAMRGQWIVIAPGVGIMGRYIDRQDAKALYEFRMDRGLRTEEPVFVRPSDDLFDDKRSGRPMRKRDWEARERVRLAAA